MPRSGRPGSKRSVRSIYDMDLGKLPPGNTAVLIGAPETRARSELNGTSPDLELAPGATPTHGALRAHWGHVHAAELMKQ